ncbi:MAG: magnesium chelatase [Chloroflexi bacterium]|nr:magnesium chelatase [Chloroflexota bacterium]
MTTSGAKPRTIGELRRSGYKVTPIKAEMRKNLVEKLRRGEDLFQGIVGYEETVIPQVENAVLAGQDMIFLGERGQAKSRLIRSLINFLDPEVPYIGGCEIMDNPFAPICKACRDKVEKLGDKVEVAWLPREERYAEKLATPDITIADLIGEVDPIRVAEGRYLSDELTIHYGLIPRTNRGIFSVNELPDLAERVQVGLFNLLEERDIQIKGYRIRLPLDVYIVASANPEDYTNRGRIITPLKDRYGAQIRTHYPRTLEQEIQIVEQERTSVDDIGIRVVMPVYMREIIAEITNLARRSSDINQRSGVSVRVSIANDETLVSNAVRRAIRCTEEQAIPRISDLGYLIASTAGKIEMESVEEGSENRVLEQLTKKAVANIFGRYFNVHDFDDLVRRFEEGLVMETSDMTPSAEYAQKAREVPEFAGGLRKLGVDEHPASIASAVEFILEGLHLNRRLNRDRVEGKIRYRG